jgi:hypothetical protein
MKEQLYICNKTNDPRCLHCKESEPHTININPRVSNEKCTSWAPCTTDEGVLIFKVRCIKVKK